MSGEIGTAGLDIDDLALRLKELFPDDLHAVRVQDPDTIIGAVERQRLKQLAARLHDLPETAFDSLTLISSVDHETHFEVVYHLYSYPANAYLQLHVRLPRTNPAVETVSDIWPSADWCEREAWDMMGIRFNGHPDLRRILLKDDWVGHPLRKDYVDVIENHPHV